MSILIRPIIRPLFTSEVDPFGPELVTNGTFDTNVDNWTFATASNGEGSATWVAGKARVEKTTVGGVVGIRPLSIAVENGKSYRIQVEGTFVSGNARAEMNIRTSPTGPSSGTSIQIYNMGTGVSFNFEQLWQADATANRNFWIRLANVAGVFDIDNVSIREVL